MKCSSYNPFHLKQLLLATAILGTASSAHAVDINWLGGTANWNTTTNWDGGNIPNLTTERAVFDGNVGTNAVTYANFGPGNYNGGVLVKAGQTTGLSIDPQAAGGIFRLGGGTGIEIESGAGAFSFGTGATTSQIFGGNGGTLTFNNNSANTATLGTNVTLYSNTLGAVMQFTGSGDWLLNSTNAGAANVSYIKDGAGTTTLAGTSTYTGTTTVNGGRMQFAKAASFYNSVAGSVSGANAAKLTVNTGGTAAFNVGGATGFTAADITTLLGASNGTVGFKTGSTIGIDTTNAVGGFTFSTNLANPTGSTSLGLTKLGTGTLTLSNSNTYSGTTTITGGTLALTGTGSIDNSSGVSLGTVGTFDVSGRTGGAYTVNNLSGSGTVIGALTVSTSLAIGNSPGTVNFNGNLTLGSGNISNFEIDAALDISDLAIVNNLNALHFDGTLNITNLDGTLANGDVFNLFDFNIANVDGTFDTINLPSLDSGLTWNTSNLYTDGTIAVIPEPAAALLGSLGMLALLRRRRN